MSPITKEFTKEQLQQIIETDHVQCGEASSLARIALASLESDSKLSDFVASQESLGGEFEGVLTENIESLYVTSNPAVQITSRDLDEGFEKWYTRDECGTNSIAPEWFSEALKPVFLETWRACRAAMLQGAEPVTTAYKLPANVIDALEKALQATSFMGDTLNDMDAVCEEDIEYVTPAFDAVRKVLEGNSPVIPDGWVACSERMPEVGVKVLCFPVNDEPIHATYNGQVWLQDISWSTSDEPIDNVISCNVFHWMPLPAAPQQEVESQIRKGKTVAREEWELGARLTKHRFKP